MDFIEKLFGISPDRGNGSFELLLFLIPVVVLAIVWFSRSSHRKRR